MTGYLPQDHNVARLDDMRARADTHRSARRDTTHLTGPAPATRADAHTLVEACIAIRRATDEDRIALECLAALDSRRALWGEILVAEVDGEAQAAVEIASGAAIADPMRPTAHVVALLRLRAAGLRDGTHSPRRLRRRSRRVYRTA